MMMVLRPRRVLPLEVALVAALVAVVVLLLLSLEELQLVLLSPIPLL